jgi:DNA-binding LacI/PurR family transcriptional regulator
MTEYPDRPKGFYRIRSVIRDLVEKDGLKSGDPLPSNKKLAELTGVNHITLRKSLVLLEQEGLINISDRKGTFVGKASRLKEAEFLDIGTGEIVRKKSTAKERLIGISITSSTTFWSEGAKAVYAPDVFQEEFARAGYEMVLLSPKIQSRKYSPSAYIFISPEMRLMGHLLADCHRTSTPWLFLHGHTGDMSHNVVTLDMKKAGRLHTRDLLQKGHRRIAFIGGHAQHSIDRYEGYCEELTRDRIDIDPALIHSSAFDKKTVIKRMHGFLSLADPPTAVICFNDVVAASVIDWCLEKKLTVPGDMAVAGFDDRPESREGSVPITTIPARGDDLAKRAVKLLVSMIEDGREKVPSVILKPALSIRQSTDFRR